MKKLFKRSLFIFRRDLRLDDNTSLMKAMDESVEVAPCFIFDPRQVDDNAGKSMNALQFMIECIGDLSRRLKEKNSALHLLHGKQEEVISGLIEAHGIEAVYANSDYTPFSRERDMRIADACSLRGVPYLQSEDYLLHPVNSYLKKDGKPYTVFTPFYKNASAFQVPLPKKFRFRNFSALSIPGSLDEKFTSEILPRNNNLIPVRGGRDNAVSVLKNIRICANYANEHDYPYRKGTSGLSPFIKFGACSIREVYHAAAKTLGKSHPLIRQLYWHDFFMYIAYHYPRVFSGSFREKYNKVTWERNDEYFKAWCEGKTGFPLVDAGMRELAVTGIMHNRVRMITASFLTKDLHIDWRTGERFFAAHLADYDPAINNGNWQWAASTGCDAQPYFRIFNPWLQQMKYDPLCAYIKKWVPELRGLEPGEIHTLHKRTTDTLRDYPTPIVDHAVESKKAKEYFKTAL